MSFATRVLLWRDFYDDEIVLFATGDEPAEQDPDAPPPNLCVLGCLHLDAILDLFGFRAYTRIAKETRETKHFPVEISLRFYHEDE